MNSGAWRILTVFWLRILRRQIVIFNNPAMQSPQTYRPGDIYNDGYFLTSFIIIHSDLSYSHVKFNAQHRKNRTLEIRKGGNIVWNVSLTFSVSCKLKTAKKFPGNNNRNVIGLFLFFIYTIIYIYTYMYKVFFFPSWYKVCACILISFYFFSCKHMSNWKLYSLNNK